jgi:thiamine biosynthesis lipoprotein
MTRARFAATLCAAALAAACWGAGPAAAPRAPGRPEHQAAPSAEPAPPDPGRLVQILEGRPAMGTILEITLVARDEPQARALLDRCFAETERLEGIFTTWRPDGELAQLNAKAGRGPQPASPELLRILHDARTLADVGGAFDVTVGPLVALWRAAAARGERPSDAAIDAARARVGAERIRLDEAAGTVELERGMSIDLGGIAKGWALDRLRELLSEAGIGRALLNFGGSSLAALGAPQGAPSWRVALDGRVLELEPGADVSISESFGQTLEVGVRRFSHIVDARSGRALERSVRVIARAPSGAAAEVWSTALVVLAATDECAGGGPRTLSTTRAAGAVAATIDCSP